MCAEFIDDNFSRPNSGLVNGWRPKNVGAGEFTFMQNVRQYAGSIVTRGGTVAQGSSLGSATVTFVMNVYGSDASVALVFRLAVCGTVLKYKIGAGAWTNLQTGLTAGTYWVGVQYKGHVYMVDGVNTPLDITIANPPTVTSYVTLPSGINPTWIVLHLNKLKYAGDLTTPDYYYQTEFGTPGTTLTTSFYLQPDDQNGNFPKVGVNCFRNVLLLCQDYMVLHTGAGPNSDQFYPMPRGAANTARRTAVDMGEFGVMLLTARGVASCDGRSVEPIDPFERINFGDIDLTTEDSCWAFRASPDVYRLYFKSKGDIGTSTASAASILSASIESSRFSSYLIATSILTRAPFVVAGTAGVSDHYYDFDCRLKQWSGPHVGSHLCGALEQYRYGDTQNPWVGDSTTGGMVLMADQSSSFTDNSAPIVCVLRTGVIGNAYKKTRIKHVSAKFAALKGVNTNCRIAIWQNGSVTEPPNSVYSANLNSKSIIGDAAGSLNRSVDMENFVQIDYTPKYDNRPVGLEQQIEYKYTGGEGFAFLGHVIEYEEVP